MHVLRGAATLSKILSQLDNSTEIGPIRAFGSSIAMPLVALFAGADEIISHRGRRGDPLIGSDVPQTYCHRLISVM